ncbi:hypothetical protein [Lachnoclostridium sp.]|uniref:hypothetical protein n=1 Tax=Lachnoclostridium sp. TaxID=2028282 RepID=UPI0028A18813|nr:hypothetical protein [Lachnoclostridium sp.]
MQDEFDYIILENASYKNKNFYMLTSATNIKFTYRPLYESFILEALCGFFSFSRRRRANEQIGYNQVLLFHYISTNEIKELPFYKFCEKDFTEGKVSIDKQKIFSVEKYFEKRINCKSELLIDLIREYEYQLCNQFNETNHNILKSERICGYNEELAFEYLCKQLDLNKYPKGIFDHFVIDNY